MIEGRNIIRHFSILCSASTRWHQKDAKHCCFQQPSCWRS